MSKGDVLATRKVLKVDLHADVQQTQRELNCVKHPCSKRFLAYEVDQRESQPRTVDRLPDVGHVTSRAKLEGSVDLRYERKRKENSTGIAESLQHEG